MEAISPVISDQQSAGANQLWPTGRLTAEVCTTYLAAAGLVGPG